MKWARPVSRAGSHYRSGSACALFPHNSILCVYIRRRAGALAEISARATTILGKRASPPTKRKQGMSGASPVKPASLANRAGSLHINRPSVWRKHLHACRTKNTNIHKGKCFFVAIFRASLSTFIYSALRFLSVDFTSRWLTVIRIKTFMEWTLYLALNFSQSVKLVNLLEQKKRKTVSRLWLCLFASSLATLHRSPHNRMFATGHPTSSCPCSIA